MYPAYQTFKALDGKDKEARAQLLRYWAVFAAFASVEFYTDMLISWVPFYYEMKMLILLYLSIPFTKGSATLYEMHMKPWLRAHQAEIDEAIAQARSSIVTVVISYRDRLASWAHENISGFLQSKVPAMFPLYSMLVALASETMKHLFVSPPPSPCSSLASSMAYVPAYSEPETIIATVSSEVIAKVELAPVATAPISAPVTAAAVLSATPTESASAHHARSVSCTASVPQTGSTRSRRTATTSVAAVSSTRTSSTSASRKIALSGTAMPQRSSAPRPTPSATKKDAVICHILEEDSILSSPQKRSNPKLHGSPQRRTAV